MIGDYPNISVMNTVVDGYDDIPRNVIDVKNKVIDFDERKKKNF